MKVVLTEDVAGVGDIGDTVSVRPGFARNFLIPRGLAFESETSRARSVAHLMRQVESKKRRLKGAASDVADRLRNVALPFTLRVASGGRVFGSVGAKDIAQKLAELGFEFDRRRVLLAEPLKKVGTHYARVRLHAEVEALVKVEIAGLEATKEEEHQETKGARQNLEAFAADRDEE